MDGEQRICNITVRSIIETYHHKEVQQDIPDKVDVVEVIIIDDDQNDATQVLSIMLMAPQDLLTRHLGQK